MVKNLFLNKVILITGASSGLGKTFTDFFLKEGARLIVCSRRNNFKGKYYSKNKNFYYYKFDLRKVEKINLFIKRISKKFKKIDILINNAGVAIPKKIERLEYKNLLNSFKVNFFAPSIITREVLKIMKKKIW